VLGSWDQVILVTQRRQAYWSVACAHSPASSRLDAQVSKQAVRPSAVIDVFRVGVIRAVSAESGRRALSRFNYFRGWRDNPPEISGFHRELPTFEASGLGRSSIGQEQQACPPGLLTRSANASPEGFKKPSICNDLTPSTGRSILVFCPKIL